MNFEDGVGFSKFFKNSPSMTILQPSLSEPAGLSAAVPDVHLQPVMGFMSFQKPSKTRRLEKKVPKHFSPLCLLSLNLWAWTPSAVGR